MGLGRLGGVQVRLLVRGGLVHVLVAYSSGVPRVAAQVRDLQRRRHFHGVRGQVVDNVVVVQVTRSGLFAVLDVEVL